MSVSNRRAGRYSANDGITLPPDGFTGRPEVECPDVGPQARNFWISWSTSPYGHFFRTPEWQDLHDTTILMDRFYEGESKLLGEARQHTSMLFGLGVRARLHVTEEQPATEAVAVAAKPRNDPRLKAV